MLSPYNCPLPSSYRSKSAIFDIVYTFLLAAIALTLMPGPDILYVLTESLATGRKYGIAIACGLVTGLLWHTTLTATGAGLLIKSNAMLYDLVTYAGVAYLFYLAYTAYQSQPSPPSDTQSKESASTESIGKLYLRGITMNVLNPKVTIFFLALLPGFVSAEATHPIREILVLGGVFMLQAIVIFIAVAYLADRLRHLIVAVWFWQWIYWIRIGVLVGIAVLLLVH